MANLGRGRLGGVSYGRSTRRSSCQSVTCALSVVRTKPQLKRFLPNKMRRIRSSWGSSHRRGLRTLDPHEGVPRDRLDHPDHPDRQDRRRSGAAEQGQAVLAPQIRLSRRTRRRAEERKEGVIYRLGERRWPASKGGVEGARLVAGIADEGQRRRRRRRTEAALLAAWAAVAMVLTAWAVAAMVVVAA